MSAPSPTNDPRITAPTKAKSTSTSGDCDGSVTKSKMSASVRSCVESDVPVDASDLDAYRKLLDEQDVKSKQPNQFWKNKYEKEAVKNWDRFYNRNQDNFYKDRHYIPFVFAELAEEEHSDRDDSKGTTGPAAGSLDSAASFSRKSFLEVGCGVGNALFPIAQQHPHLDCFGVDCSKNAVGICKKNPAYLAASEGAGEGGARLGVEVCDITSQRIPAEIAGDGGQSIDFASMIFVLSSIAPEKHLQTLFNVNRALQLGALLYFRKSCPSNRVASGPWLSHFASSDTGV